jgi:aminoglycoside phosphotransferase (APT) family kinase protein
VKAERARILAEFRVGPAQLIGEGGESLVYELGPAHVLRLPRAGHFPPGSRAALQAFLRAIDGRFPFATPSIEEIGPDDTWTVEARLPGHALSPFLKTAHDDSRDRALRSYARAVEEIATVRLDDLPYGHIVAHEPVTAPDWRLFLRESLDAFRSRNRVAIARDVGDPYALQDRAADLIMALPDLPTRSLVHGDYFPGNVLIGPDLEVSAVLDFGPYTVCGDPTLDLAVSYLTLELIDETTADDARFVRELLVERHGEEILPAFRFYRAWLAFSMADPANGGAPYPKLYAWSIAMLRLLAEGRLPA